MITFDEVSLGYPDPIVNGVSFEIAEGDLCLVVGRTGTGKSTLLQAINGLVPHFTGATMSGEVTVDGRSTRTHRPRDLADVVGFVAQNPLAGFVTDTVEDEVAYGMEQLGLSPTAMRKRVEETLDLMGIAELRRRPLTELSGGQQQRVAIAAVLAAQPRVLVLDEPTSALDPTAAQDVLAAITTLVHDVGLTVVLAEHRLERVTQATDQVLWLPGDGSAHLGPAAEVLATADVVPPLSELARALDWTPTPLSVREARRRVAREHLTLRPSDPAAGGAECSPADATARSKGAQRPMRDRAPGGPGGTECSPAVNTESSPAVSTAQLTVRYGDLEAVAGVTFSLQAGTVIGLMGRNGSGKSSLLGAIQGGVKSTGRLDVAGRDPRTLNPKDARRVVSMVPQTAADLLYLPTVGDECRQADREGDLPEGTTASLLRELGADLDPDRNPRDLSEGQRLALVLAIQLGVKPQVMILDEPTRGLDYTMKHHLRGLLHDLAERGTCVIVSTHDVEFAAGATSRTVLMAEGEIIADGPTREICTGSPAFAPQVAKVFWPEPVLTVDDVMARWSK